MRSVAALFLALSMSLVLTQTARAAGSNGSKTVETAGTAVAIALPLLAAGLTVEKHDWKGTAQLGVETLLTVGTAYALKQFVRERRPDGSDYQSFPSDTTAVAASGAAFLWGRYGWQYGLPAFAATEFVAYSRCRPSSITGMTPSPATPSPRVMAMC